MLIAGINLGSTRSSKQLRDGGACIVSDGRILVATAEERISRNKRAGGFDQSLPAILRHHGLTIKDLDHVVVSSCCENTDSISGSNALVSFAPDKIHFVSHHLSHAVSCFGVSNFEEALIIVADAGGSVLEGNSPKWWTLPREQSTYYIGSDRGIQLIGRDFDGPYEAGLGEIFRYFTHHLGWKSTDAGKVMSVAALGDPKRFRHVSLVTFNSWSGQLESSIANDPVNPATLPRFFAENGFTAVPARNPQDEVTQVHFDLARYVQDQVGDALLGKITHLSKESGLRQLCLAGGVALNCVINDRILRETPIERIFVQPAAGDHGQSLGNAIWGANLVGEWVNGQGHFSPYLGIQYDWNLEIAEVSHILADRVGIQCTYHENNTLLRVTAARLADGKIVGWVQGRSEIGPRALGNRSILADPRQASSKQRLNSIKKREWFVPVAPAVLEEAASEYFQTDWPSPYMLRAVPVRAMTSALVPAVIHADNSARIQTVNREQNTQFYDLIAEFGKLSGVPILANTSFNGKGQPIVETAKEAAISFLDLGLDMLVIGNWIFERS